MPAIVQLDLSQVLTSADELICRWIELPTSVRTIAAFENLLIYVSVDTRAQVPKFLSF